MSNSCYKGTKIKLQKDEITENLVKCIHIYEKQKQKLNLSIGIQKNSSLNKKPNNLNKFKFDSGENIKINKFNENQNNSTKDKKTDLQYEQGE